jgi:hypothetical protein
VYVPILAAARDSPEIFQAMNYVWDTLLFGGTSLLLATALQDHADASRLVAGSSPASPRP